MRLRLPSLLSTTTALVVGTLATLAPLSPAAPATPPSRTVSPAIDWVVTTGDQRSLVASQPAVSFGRDRHDSSALVVDESLRFQPHVGVGAAMTESSAYLLARLPAAARTATLHSIFHPSEGAGVSVLRVPLGASDFALDDYTYNDLPPGVTDPQLHRFSTAREQQHVVPVLQQAQSVNPSLRLVLSAWSPPAWMKDSGTTHGGSLLPAYEATYATYLARAAQEFVASGLQVTAMTVVNEPNHSTADYPTTLMPVDQRVRVAAMLRAELDTRGLASVGILSHDHNWDDTAAPIRELTTAPPGTYVGSAFHCYAGDVSAQSVVAETVPGTQIWTTECAGGSWSGGFSEDLRWGMRHMLIGAFRHHSRGVLWWNLALDPASGPKNGGCQNCRGVLTVDPEKASTTRNVEYWLLTHVGRYVPRGSVRVGTTGGPHGVEGVAFVTPEGRRVLLLLNDGTSKQTVTVRWNGQAAQLSLPRQSVATATW